MTILQIMYNPVQLKKPKKYTTKQGERDPSNTKLQIDYPDIDNVNNHISKTNKLHIAGTPQNQIKNVASSKTNTKYHLSNTNTIKQEI